MRETRNAGPTANMLAILARMPGLPILGLDMSANATGVVVLTNELTVEYARTIEPDCTGAERLHEIYATLTTIARRFGPFAAVVREDYALGATNKPYLLGEVGGIAQVALYPHTGRFFEVAPKQLKKFASGNASATKGEVMEAVKHRYGFATTSDDIADAYVLARIGACLTGYDTPEERPALEVIHAIIRKAIDGVKAPKRRAIARGASVLAHELEG
jgi:Holliday junction resolvasome RuvABC endonuclease subunit